MKILWGILFMGVLVACDEEKSDEAEHDPEPKKEVLIDSSWYYDSLNAPYIDDIQSYFKERATSHLFNGVYLFAQNGYVIDSGLYGVKNQDENDSLSFNTAFQLASGSKPFTATAILKLVEEGKLGLDDSVHHIIDLPYKGITVRMLLNHRGGLGNYIYFTEHLFKDTNAILTNQGILDILKDTVPKIYYPPNTHFDYSNTGYALLACIVEKVTGKAFKTHMKEAIFEPLGMEHSFILDITEPLPKHAATGYVGQSMRDPGNLYLDGVVGDKGMYSTVHDMLMFDQALYNGFLSDSLMELAMSAQNPILSNGDSYGYGWRLIHPDTEDRIVHHTGWWHGFRSFFIRYPKEKKTVIVLDNIKRSSCMGTKELLGLFAPAYQTEDLPLEVEAKDSLGK